MNLLSQFEQLFASQEKAIARIQAQRRDGQWVAATLTGAVVILIGDTEAGKSVYYDRVSNQILSEAPAVSFAEYGV